MSEDLHEFEKVEEIVVAISFNDAEGNNFFGGLSMDERDYNSARSRSTCPKHKQSFEYYEFLRDKAEAIPCSIGQNNPPLTKRSPQGAVLAIYLYAINSTGLLEFHEASIYEVRAAAREDATYRMTAFMFQMHLQTVQKQLKAPSID